ncbi:hypothetical protein BDV93DRAFT_557427 [Ceratobasidium sp. AG-I]|nr:hypothetical protein BDV93DRAFT_557427 [Ceratobasidium sp. AG-I]
MNVEHLGVDSCSKKQAGVGDSVSVSEESAESDAGTATATRNATPTNGASASGAEDHRSLLSTITFPSYVNGLCSSALTPLLRPFPLVFSPETDRPWPRTIDRGHPPKSGNSSKSLGFFILHTLPAYLVNFKAVRDVIQSVLFVLGMSTALESCGEVEWEAFRRCQLFLNLRGHGDSFWLCTRLRQTDSRPRLLNYRHVPNESFFIFERILSR